MRLVDKIESESWRIYVFEMEQYKYLFWKEGLYDNLKLVKDEDIFIVPALNDDDALKIVDNQYDLLEGKI